MSDAEVEQLQVADVQRKRAKRATFEKMLGKKRAFDEFEVLFPGDEEPTSFYFEAIPGPEYDELLTQAPPSTKQKARGATYDPERFSCLLLGKVCKDPQLTPEQWKDIQKTGGWSGGEYGMLMERAVELCMKQMDPTPTSAD